MPKFTAPVSPKSVHSETEAPDDTVLPDYDVLRNEDDEQGGDTAVTDLENQLLDAADDETTLGAQQMVTDFDTRLLQ